jgi:hypothetical protein
MMGANVRCSAWPSRHVHGRSRSTRTGTSAHGWHGRPTLGRADERKSEQRKISAPVQAVIRCTFGYGLVEAEAETQVATAYLLALVLEPRRQALSPGHLPPGRADGSPARYEPSAPSPGRSAELADPSDGLIDGIAVGDLDVVGDGAVPEPDQPVAAGDDLRVMGGC